MKRALVLFVALLVVAGVIVGVALARTHTDKVTLPSREVDTFLHAWSRSDAAEMATLLDRPVTGLPTVASSLLVAVPGSTATYTRTGISGTAADATATYHAEIALKGLGPDHVGRRARPRAHQGRRLADHLGSERAVSGRWAPGNHLTAETVWPLRGSILADNGAVLAGSQSVVQIGLEPDHIKTPADLAAVKFSMQSVLGVDGATIDKALHAPGVRPNYFLPVVKVPRDADYDHIHDTLLPIPGIIFRPATGVSSTDDALGPGILGTVGDVTADGLKQLGAPYKSGDQVGLNGLQAVYEKQLAGTPTTDVVIADAQGRDGETREAVPGHRRAAR